MSNDVSISISAKDNFTDAIATMKNATRNFRTDIEGTKQKLDELNKTKVVLKADTQQLQTELKAAQKAYTATGSAADKAALQLSGAKYDQAKQNLNLVSKSANQAEKDILNMTSAIEKADNRAGMTSFGKSSINESSVQETVKAKNSTLSGLGKAGLTQMIGDTAQGLIGQYVSSKYGGETGTLINSALGGAASGAAIGTTIAPGIGTAVGAAAGTVAGFVQGYTKNQENKDDAFKTYVQEQYESTQEEQKQALENGSSIAANREKTKIAYTTMLKSEKEADSLLATLQKMANETPLEYDDVTKLGRTLLTYKYSTKEIPKQMQIIGNAGAATGMNVEDENEIATALGRMKTSKKTTLEYLNIIQDRGVDAIGALAKGNNLTVSQTYYAISKGLLDGEKSAKLISEYMEKTYKNGMKLQSETFLGKQSTLQDAQDNLDAQMGTGYNKVKTKGMQTQIDFLSGSYGDKMGTAYSQIGAWKASEENKKQQMQDDAVKTVLNSDMYKNLGSDDASVAKKGEMMAEAMVKANNDYLKTSGAKLLQQTNISLAQSIQQSSSDSYQNAGYNLGQTLMNGIQSAIDNMDIHLPTINYSGTGGKQSYPNLVTLGNSKTGTGLKTLGNSGSSSALSHVNSKSTSSGGLSSLPKSGGTGLSTLSGSGSGGLSYIKRAIGVPYVPRDNYPILAHQGERLLTASEARSQSSQKSAPVTITGNSFTVRKESDINEIATALYKKMERAESITPNGG